MNASRGLEPEKSEAIRFVCRSVYLKYGDIYSQDRMEASFYTELSLNLALMCQDMGTTKEQQKGTFFFNIQDGQYGTEGGLRKKSWD